MSRKPQACQPSSTPHCWPMGHSSWPTKSCCRHASEDTRCWHMGRAFLGGWHLFTRHWPEPNIPIRNRCTLQGVLIHVLNFCSVQSPGVEKWLDPHLGACDANLLASAGCQLWPQAAPLQSTGGCPNATNRACNRLLQEAADLSPSKVTTFIFPRHDSLFLSSSVTSCSVGHPGTHPSRCFCIYFRTWPQPGSAQSITLMKRTERRARSNSLTINK